MTELTPLKRRVMTHYVEHACEFVLPFRTVAAALDIPRPSAKRAVRQLARDGLLKLETGFTDDGEIAGRGYSLTADGHKWGREQGLKEGGFAF